MSSTTTLEQILNCQRRDLLPRAWVVAACTILAGVLVRFNTIVHPFTLADNRHYTFYVFRLLMRPWWVKYAVTPVYVLCGWACIQALGTSTASVAAEDSNPAPGQSASPSSMKLLLPDTKSSATTSFVLIWLATSALQLVTAPLVEPRYFILPWIYWRMHLPMQQPRQGRQSMNNGMGASAWSKAKRAVWDDHDHRLWVETVWFLTVNAATAYIFLAWTFEWPQEPGEVQRFMW